MHSPVNKNVHRNSGLVADVASGWLAGWPLDVELPMALCMNRR